jgi:23S rRNA (uracil1939-C5)-methyltransferase
MSADTYFPDAPELRGSIRLTSGGPTLTMMGGRSWAAREQFRAATPSLAAVWWEPAEETGQSRRLLYDNRVDRSPGASFAQVNAEMAAVLRAYVLERVLEADPATAVDAYSGAGQVAVALSENGIATTAIELDSDAAEWAALQIKPPSRSICARVEDVLASTLPADLVIINPPRAGVDSAVTDILEQHAPTLRRVIYVSCNPATLARDLARLPSFEIASLRGFDMFPQTAHVETVCELRPAGRAA